jgi:site-specific recombinase XerC
MRLRPEQAHAILPQVDPGRLRSGRPVGLRDGALLALVAAGLSAVEIAGLKASAVTMAEGRLVVSVHRQGVNWSAILPADLGARLLAWLSERRLWAVPEPVFQGLQGPLTAIGVRQVLGRYRKALLISQSLPYQPRKRDLEVSHEQA